MYCFDFSSLRLRSKNNVLVDEVKLLPQMWQEDFLGVDKEILNRTQKQLWIIWLPIFKNHTGEQKWLKFKILVLMTETVVHKSSLFVLRISAEWFLEAFLKKLPGGTYLIISNRGTTDNWSELLLSFLEKFSDKQGQVEGHSESWERGSYVWAPAAPSLRSLVSATIRQPLWEQADHASSCLVARPHQVDMTTRLREEPPCQPGKAVSGAWPVSHF